MNRIWAERGKTFEKRIQVLETLFHDYKKPCEFALKFGVQDKWVAAPDNILRQYRGKGRRATKAIATPPSSEYTDCFFLSCAIGLLMI